MYIIKSIDSSLAQSTTKELTDAGNSAHPSHPARSPAVAVTSISWLNDGPLP